MKDEFSLNSRVSKCSARGSRNVCVLSCFVTLITCFERNDRIKDDKLKRQLLVYDAIKERDDGT